jgi:hypothetical protein
MMTRATQAGDQFLLEVGQAAEVLLDEEQRAGHHAGVVTEQQAATHVYAAMRGR